MPNEALFLPTAGNLPNDGGNDPTGNSRTVGGDNPRAGPENPRASDQDRAGLVPVLPAGLDPAQFFKQLMDALSKAGISLGSPGGGRGGRGGGGGGSSAIDPNSLQGSLEGLIRSDLANPLDPKIDPRFQQQLTEIQQAIGKLSSGPLAGLDPETQAQMDQILKGRLGESDASARQAQDQLITRLFGQGVQNSSIAGGAAAAQAFESERLKQGIISDDAGQRLNLRLANRQFALEGLTARAGIVTEQQGAALQTLGIQQETFLAERQRRAGLLSDILSNQTAIKTAQISASAQRYASDKQQQNVLIGGYLDNLNRLQDAYQFERSQGEVERQFNISRKITADTNRDAKRAQNIATIVGIIGLLSDEKIKTDVKPYVDTGILGAMEAELHTLIPRSYTNNLVPWNTRGFIAQEVEVYLPQYVMYVEDLDLKMVMYPELAADLYNLYLKWYNTSVDLANKNTDLVYELDRYKAAFGPLYDPARETDNDIF